MSSFNMRLVSWSFQSAMVFSWSFLYPCISVLYFKCPIFDALVFSPTGENQDIPYIDNSYVLSKSYTFTVLFFIALRFPSNNRETGGGGWISALSYPSSLHKFHANQMSSFFRVFFVLNCLSLVAFELPWLALATHPR